MEKDLHKTLTKTFRLIVIISTLLFWGVPFPVSAQKPVFRVVHINPMNTPFWHDLADFMQAAADDLNISLDIKNIGTDRYNIKDIADKLLIEDEKPEFMIYLYQVDVSRRMLESAEAAGVYSLLINTDVPKEQRAVLGQPREKLPHWIGHMVPDDFQVGYDLAETLFNSARKAGKYGKDGKIHVVGLSGSRDSTAAIYRNKGLESAVTDNPDVVLHQIFWTYWDTGAAEKMVPAIFYRYPETSVIWAVFDGNALGAIKGLEGIGKIPGRDVFTGGIDWSDEGLKAVQEGKLVATYGGHFMDGAWSLILAYDFFYGKDFEPVLGATIKTKMQKIDKSTVDKYIKLIGRRDWSKIDFTQFTRAHHAERAGYNFSIETMIK